MASNITAAASPLKRLDAGVFGRQAPHRPGRIVREWTVEVHGQRRIEAPEVAALAVEITDHLREEIRRHAV